VLKAKLLVAASLSIAAWPTAGAAAELFGGHYVHDVKTPLNLSGVEGGMDFMLGWRGGRIGATPLQPYAFGAVNTAGKTHYAAAGLSAKFGRRFFVRPGIGLAVQSGSTDDFMRTDRVAFGSRVLFEPELGIGARIGDRATVEGSWVHMSHGTLFGRQNPGIDNIGLRLTFGL
jgi:hypothetical protein